MKFTRYVVFFSLAVILFLSSCLGTSTITTSSNASFVSLSLSNNDSVTKAVFTEADSIIQNKDSLPYHTPLAKVIVTFTFQSTSTTYLIYPKNSGAPKDSVILSGKDTINFNYQPITVKNLASDGKTIATYTLKVNVHQVQPELYVWEALNSSLDINGVEHQKTLIRNDSLFYFYNDGNTTYLGTSMNGISWSKTTVADIPGNFSLDDITQFNGRFFLTNGQDIYSSSNGQNWTKSSLSLFTFKSLLFDFQNQLWAVVQPSGMNNYFAVSNDGTVWTVLSEKIPDGFPVRGFSALSFDSRLGKPKVLVLGGYDDNGNFLKNNWSSEDGNYWINYSSAISLGQHSLDSIYPGASVISYDNKLLLFGAVDKSGVMAGNYYRVSIDEGLSWQVPDTLYNRLRMPVYIKSPVTGNDTISTYLQYGYRSFQSAVVDNSSNIYIVGGRYNNTYLQMIWKGKLNRMSFLIK